MTSRQLLSAVVAAWWCAGVAAPAGTAEADWKAITAMDAGPQSAAPRTATEARDRALVHLSGQERALRAFLAAHGGDERSFEARLRLSRALQIRADVTEDAAARSEARRILDELEKVATPGQRAEVDFAKITAFMRSMGRPNESSRASLLAMARKFQAQYPSDRRIASLLVQVASLFDFEPVTKLALLEDALPLAKDDETKARVADDLKRTRLGGKVVPLSGPAIRGGTLDVAAFRGKVVLIVFFADFSPPSIVALASIQKATADLPRETVQLLGVSLDERREMVTAALQANGITWPVIFDGKGWESPAIRTLGINALPTVWLLDRDGKLRSFNALEGTVGQVRQLLR